MAKQEYTLNNHGTEPLLSLWMGTNPMTVFPLPTSGKKYNIVINTILIFYVKKLLGEIV